MVGVIIIITGLLLMALGLFAIKRPDSWWFKRLGDDSDPSESYTSYIKFIGLVISIFGLLVLTAGIMNCYKVLYSHTVILQCRHQ